jgi:hypothetical protein
MFLMSSQLQCVVMPITRQKSPVFSIVSLPTDSVIVDHAVLTETLQSLSIYYFPG